MMNPRAAAGILLIVSLLMAVALSRADARTTKGPNKTTPQAEHNTDGQVHVADVATLAVAKPECENPAVSSPPPPPPPPPSESPEPPPCESLPKPPPPSESPEPPSCESSPKPPPPSESPEPSSPSESPKPPPCESSPQPLPKPAEKTCNKGHGVQAGETCYSVGQDVGLTLDQFFSFNPNVECDHLFIGQWVCLEATSTVPPLGPALVPPPGPALLP